MAFKNLENRFNENVNKLYAGATLKFENGKSSNGRNDDPLIVRKPGNGYWNFAESRGLPVVSGLLDVKRLTLFTLSKRGLLFLAKQQLLQTGNTFEHTRIINPLFAVGNAVPFLHIRRNLRPLAIGGTVAKALSVLGIKKTSTPNSPAELRKIGQLQQETYDKWTGGSGLVKSLIKKIPVIGQTVSAFSAKRSMGEVGNGWNYSRPELGKNNSEYFILKEQGDWSKYDTKPITNPTVFNISTLKYKFNEGTSLSRMYTVNLRNDYTVNARTRPEKSAYYFSTQTARTDNLSKEGNTITLLKKYNTPESTQQFIDKQISNAVAVSQLLSDFERVKPRPIVRATALPILPEYRGKTFVRYFSKGNVGLGSINASEIVNGKGNMQERITDFKAGPSKDKRLTYIKDESNLRALAPNTSVSKKAYQSINNGFDDPIVVSFAMGTDGPIRFRAFIKDLNQSATPEYKSYQYIGRMEKFVNYVGVQREISFKLGIIAFSRDELDGVWRRINYLTGLVFPYGFNRGIFQPNIIRLTIGDVYTEQPGYVTSLNTNFNELGTSWELDGGKQVPIGAEMEIKFIIIEKSSKVADSPFYGISEEMEGFSKQLPNSGPDRTAAATPVAAVSTPAAAAASPVPNANPSTVTKTSVEVEKRTYDRTGFPDITAKPDNTRVRKPDDLVYDPFLKTYGANPRLAPAGTLPGGFVRIP